MKSSHWIIAVFVIGCTNQHGDVTATDPASGGYVEGEPQGTPPPPNECPALGIAGTIVSTLPQAGTFVAVDRDDSTFFVAAQGGIVKLDAMAQQVYAFPFGSVL